MALGTDFKREGEGQVTCSFASEKMLGGGLASLDSTAFMALSSTLTV